MLQRIFLGPQRPLINVNDAINRAQIPDGPLAVISAGWQEGEGDLEELTELLQRPLVELNLYNRANEIFAVDKKLHAAYRQRQDRLQELQQLYRVRLRQLMIAARQIRREKAASDLLAAENEHAIAQVQTLDKHLLTQAQAITAEFSEALSTARSGLLAEHARAVATAIENCATVLIPGGNVLVLLNRLQLFAMHDLLTNRHLIAWSAGAMVLSDLIVLFYDKTPLGRRDPEVLGPGLGIVPEHIILPDAKRRLQEKDRLRMSLFSERFAPTKCIALESGSMIQFDANRICRAEGAGCLSSAGNVEELRI